MPRQYDSIRPIKWENDHLLLLDQRLLPAEEHYLVYERVSDVAQAITDMVVRGAPAIGVTAAYGVVLAIRDHYPTKNNNWRNDLEPDLQKLADARPTAINLRWAIARMRGVMVDNVPVDKLVESLLCEAKLIHQQDIEANYTLSDLAAGLIMANSTVITHCNAGALATGGYGTALGVIRSAYEQNKINLVYADETRPWLQGARLTAWELKKENIPVKLIAEGAAAMLMRQHKPDWVIVGSDRIAANGDVANKIGTYSLAVNARQHGVKVMVAAPTSTIDMGSETGEDIPIEFREEAELLNVVGHRIAPDGVSAWNPVFDVTPASLVDAIVTERGIVEKPDAKKIKELMSI